MAAAMSTPAVATAVPGASRRRRANRRDLVRERVLDALAGYSGDLRWINVDFTEGGAQVSIHHHPVSVVQELCDLLGVLDDAPRVREVITPRGDYQVWGYAPDASLRGGISVTWFPDPPAGSPPAD